MTVAEQFAAFAVQTNYDDLSDPVRTQIKTLVLDTLGCAIGSMAAEPIAMIREHTEEFGGAPLCTLIGGGKTTPEQAAFLNTSLIRYLDFNDGYMGKRATCHPSDNLGALLAAGEYADADGRTLMTSLALAYEIQCRLCDVAGFENNGFDQFTAGAYAVASGASRILGMDAEKTAHAIAISGVRQNPLFVTRVGQISNWKGFAYGGGAHTVLHSTFLAKRGVTGPLSLFEGQSGVFDSVTGEFELDWTDTKLEKMRQVSVKRYTAGLHSQPAVEGALDLRAKHNIDPAQIERIDVGLYERAFFIMGSGKAGARKHIRDKETADHSLPYVVSAALLDGQLMPEQYKVERILRDDVQALFRKVHTFSSDDLTARYPAEAATTVKITLTDGTSFETEKSAYEGHFTCPMQWDTIVEKFTLLATPYTSDGLRAEIIDAVSNLESVSVRDLANLLAQVDMPAA
jgi:2-methylcitrate dehydratase